MNEYKKIAKDLKEFCSKKRDEEEKKKKKRESFVFCLKNRREREKRRTAADHIYYIQLRSTRNEKRKEYVKLFDSEKKKRKVQDAQDQHSRKEERRIILFYR